MYVNLELDFTNCFCNSLFVGLNVPCYLVNKIDFFKTFPKKISGMISVGMAAKN